MLLTTRAVHSVLSKLRSPYRSKLSLVHVLVEVEPDICWGPGHTYPWTLSPASHSLAIQTLFRFPRQSSDQMPPMHMLLCSCPSSAFEFVCIDQQSTSLANCVALLKTFLLRRCRKRLLSLEFTTTLLRERSNVVVCFGKRFVHDAKWHTDFQYNFYQVQLNCEHSASQCCCSYYFDKVTLVFCMNSSPIERLRRRPE